MPRGPLDQYWAKAVMNLWCFATLYYTHFLFLTSHLESNIH